MSTEQYANNAQTTLNGAILSGATSAVVTDPSAFPSTGNFRILIDSEIFLVSSVSGFTFTMAGAQEGTIAAAHSNGAAVTHLLTAASIRNLFPYSVCNGRLTTESGVPVSSADRTAQGTIYFTPYLGAQIGIFDGTNWGVQTFTEISLALSSLTSGKNYDVFVYLNAGTLTLELSAAWSSDTVRTDALTTQNGVTVKSGATTRRWLGTIRTTGTTTTEDSAAKRFVWNRHNQTRRSLVAATETTDSWAYTTATFRQANANAANQLDYVTGDASTLIEARVHAMMQNSTAGTASSAGVGVDSTSTNSAQVHGTNSGGTAGIVVVQHAGYVGQPGLGRHFVAWLEYSAATGTATWFGDAGNATIYQSGITGTIWN